MPVVVLRAILVGFQLVCTHVHTHTHTQRHTSLLLLILKSLLLNLMSLMPFDQSKWPMSRVYSALKIVISIKININTTDYV